ncbi:MAG TPA: hypothetical protein HPP97_00540 [Desulfuromonadales bacterium]|nr:hypothetical protein [Desulfuromonadales bacterium]
MAGSRIPVTVILDQMIETCSIENVHALYPNWSRSAVLPFSH